ncbi:hypothetical protein GE061_004096 [Apolygus lucorum]|uniref:Uncharacterized protein n=1 Tax=Apolygus lucorum TaxID=248454 RepID=A0A8S9X032_APOLU|nr:hypothetical protein GE061_004096 [Apolygus lucorum]
MDPVRLSLKVFNRVPNCENISAVESLSDPAVAIVLDEENPYRPSPLVSYLRRRLLLLVLMAVTGCITHKPNHGEDFNLTDALKSRYDKAKAVFEDLQKYYKGSKLEKLVQAAQKYRDKHMNDPLEPVFKKLASWSKPNGKFSSIYELYKQLIKTGNKKPNIDSEEIKSAGRMAANTVRYKPKKLQAARFMMYPPVIGDINSEPFLPNNLGMEDPMMDGGLEGPKDPEPPPPPPPKKENKESSGLGSYDFGGGLSQKKGGKNQAGNEQKWPVQGVKWRESGGVTYIRHAG